MARPKSEDKRDALMAAAARVIAAQGLSAPTAVIAREAGVSNGSLFTYFETKADLFNQLYLELKTGMATASLEGLPVKAPLSEQLSRMWSNWMRWGTSSPGKRRALALLDVSDDIAGETAPPRIRPWRKSRDCSNGRAPADRCGTRRWGSS
jgi:AcrR family transcriptional regulator